jgi:two-component system sensor histidine kinase KdpD
MRQRNWSRLILRTAILGAGLMAVSLLYHYTIRANSTTAALTYLLVVLGSATFWGLPEAAVASVFSILCLDYYFLPPVPALGIDDPQNWVAWGTFLITSFVVSELSARLKKRAQEATQRQSEIQRMYALSCSLMQASAATALAQDIPAQVVKIFGCPGVAFFDALSGQIHRAGIPAGISDAALMEAAGSADLSRAAPGNPALVPVNLGAGAVGSLAFCEASISAPAMQSIANLIALAMDRVRKQEAAAQAEGARRHLELKATLLDALAHDFQTPLTSIRAGIDAMLAESPGRDQREWLEIMDQESGRLSAMMTQAIQMARIEAGHVDLDRQMHTVEDLVYPGETDGGGFPNRSRFAAGSAAGFRRRRADPPGHSGNRRECPEVFPTGRAHRRACARRGYRRGHQRHRPRAWHSGGRAASDLRKVLPGEAAAR